MEVLSSSFSIPGFTTQSNYGLRIMDLTFLGVTLEKLGLLAAVSRAVQTETLSVVKVVGLNLNLSAV